MAPSRNQLTSMETVPKYPPMASSRANGKPPSREAAKLQQGSFSRRRSRTASGQASAQYSSKPPQPASLIQQCDKTDTPTAPNFFLTIHYDIPAEDPVDDDVDTICVKREPDVVHRRRGSLQDNPITLDDEPDADVTRMAIAEAESPLVETDGSLLKKRRGIARTSCDQCAAMKCKCERDDVSQTCGKCYKMGRVCKTQSYATDDHCVSGLAPDRNQQDIMGSFPSHDEAPSIDSSSAGADALVALALVEAQSTDVGPVFPGEASLSDSQESIENKKVESSRVDRMRLAFFPVKPSSDAPPQITESPLRPISPSSTPATSVKKVGGVDGRSSSSPEDSEVDIDEPATCSNIKGHNGFKVIVENNPEGFPDQGRFPAERRLRPKRNSKGKATKGKTLSKNESLLSGIRFNLPAYPDSRRLEEEDPHGEPQSLAGDSSHPSEASDLGKNVWRLERYPLTTWKLGNDGFMRQEEEFRCGPTVPPASLPRAVPIGYQSTAPQQLYSSITECRQITPKSPSHITLTTENASSDISGKPTPISSSITASAASNQQVWESRGASAPSARASSEHLTPLGAWSAPECLPKSILKASAGTTIQSSAESRTLSDGSKCVSDAVQCSPKGSGVAEGSSIRMQRRAAPPTHAEVQRVDHFRFVSKPERSINDIDRYIGPGMPSFDAPMSYPDYWIAPEYRPTRNHPHPRPSIMQYQDFMSGSISSQQVTNTLNVQQHIDNIIEAAEKRGRDQEGSSSDLPRQPTNLDVSEDLAPGDSHQPKKLCRRSRWDAPRGFRFTPPTAPRSMRLGTDSQENFSQTSSTRPFPQPLSPTSDRNLLNAVSFVHTPMAAKSPSDWSSGSATNSASRSVSEPRVEPQKEKRQQPSRALELRHSPEPVIALDMVDSASTSTLSDRQPSPFLHSPRIAATRLNPSLDPRLRSGPLKSPPTPLDLPPWASELEMATTSNHNASVVANVPLSTSGTLVDDPVILAEYPQEQGGRKGRVFVAFVPDQ